MDKSWEVHIELYDQCTDLTKDQFCELHSISKWTLIDWISSRKNKTGVFAQRVTKLPEAAKPKVPSALTETDPIDRDFPKPEENFFDKQLKYIQHYEKCRPRANIIMRRDGWEIEISSTSDLGSLKRIISIFDELASR